MLTEAAASHVRIERIPISAAKLFERCCAFRCCGLLRAQHHTPMSRRENLVPLRAWRFFAHFLMALRDRAKLDCDTRALLARSKCESQLCAFCFYHKNPVLPRCRTGERCGRS